MSSRSHDHADGVVVPLVPRKPPRSPDQEFARRVTGFVLRWQELAADSSRTREEVLSLRSDAEQLIDSCRRWSQTTTPGLFADAMSGGIDLAKALLWETRRYVVECDAPALARAPASSR